MYLKVKLKKKDWKSNNDFKQALFSQSNNKAPGIDGYPPEFYKHFWSHFFFSIIVSLGAEKAKAPPKNPSDTHDSYTTNQKLVPVIKC